MCGLKEWPEYNNRGLKNHQIMSLYLWTKRVLEENTEYLDERAI